MEKREGGKLESLFFSTCAIGGVHLNWEGENFASPANFSSHAFNCLHRRIRMAHETTSCYTINCLCSKKLGLGY